MFKEIKLYANTAWPVLSEKRKLWALVHFAPIATPSQNQNHIKILFQ